jgi:hypothetical protein
MFPWDRAGYILLDITSEESMEKGWQLWAAPKEKVHAEMVKKYHNKKKGTSIDITDFVDGRIVALEVGSRETEAGTFPTYSVDLEELENEIPEEYQNQLAELCEEAEEAGFKLAHGGLIDYFLNFPEYDEVKQSHLAGMDRREESEEDEEDDETESVEFNEDDVRKELDGMSKFKIKKHAKKEWGLSIDISGKEKEEVIDAVVEALEEGEGEGERKPKCFGEFADHEKCEDCEHDEECSDATEEATE